jgi:phosphatidylinositol alpha-mannosyltransferase
MPGLRIDLLTPFYWPEVRRGTERFVHELSTGLLADGHRPRIITSRKGPRVQHDKIDRVPVLAVPRVGDGRLRRRMMEDPVVHAPFSYAALRAGDAELAHTTHSADGAVAARWSRHTGRPSVYSYMGVPTHEGLMDRRRRLELTQAAISGAAATVALSRYAADAFERVLGVEARLIPPGVDLSRFPLGTERTEEPTVVCTATLTEPRKRVALLVEAWATVRRAHPRARLLLDEPKDARLAERHAAPGVEFVRFGEPGVMAEHLGRAWAGVLCSEHEAFGLVLVEALSTGTPVVGSAGGAFGEIVDRPEVGRLFSGGADDLAEQLLAVFELAAAPETRAACRTRAEAFSTQVTTAAYEALYAELLAR